jgi:hypothetical protein
MTDLPEISEFEIPEELRPALRPLLDALRDYRDAYLELADTITGMKEDARVRKIVGGDGIGVLDIGAGTVISLLPQDGTPKEQSGADSPFSGDGITNINIGSNGSGGLLCYYTDGDGEHGPFSMIAFWFDAFGRIISASGT